MKAQKEQKTEKENTTLRIYETELGYVTHVEMEYELWKYLLEYTGREK